MESKTCNNNAGNPYIIRRITTMNLNGIIFSCYGSFKQPYNAKQKQPINFRQLRWLIQNCNFTFVAHRIMAVSESAVRAYCGGQKLPLNVKLTAAITHFYCSGCSSVGCFAFFRKEEGLLCGGSLDFPQEPLRWWPWLIFASFLLNQTGWNFPY